MPRGRPAVAMNRRTFLAAAALAFGGGASFGAAPLRLGLQKTGTVSWEIDTIRRHGLDARHGVALAVTELASPWRSPNWRRPRRRGSRCAAAASMSSCPTGFGSRGSAASARA